MAVAITKKPTLAVTGLGAPTRNGYVMSASWKLPTNLTNQNRADRAEQLGLFWYLGVAGDDPRRKTVVSTSTSSSGFNLNGGKIGNTTYYRRSFYPLTKKKLDYVTFKIMPKNAKGWGPVVAVTRKFEVPRAPTIAPFSFNTDNGVVSTTITTDAGNDYKERYDTKYTMTVTSPFVNGGKAKNIVDTASTSTSINLSYDASQYMNLSYGQYIKIEVKAFARGFKGNSKTVTRTIYVSYPAQPSITGVTVSSRDAVGKCTVRIKTNSTASHPVDKVKLQYALDVDAEVETDIAAGDWTDTEIVDNANCTALAMPAGDLLPSRGKHTWVRVVSYHLHEAVLYRYSTPRKVQALETPATPTGQIKINILGTKAGADGESAVVQLGWNADGLDDFTGTELSWSDSEDTWKSTEEPSHYEFTWSDGKSYKKTEDTSIVSGKTYYTRSGEGTEDDPYVYTTVASPSVSHLDEYYEVRYHDSATITIKGLSEGKLYYIKARRYQEDTEEYSEYSDPATVLTSETPEAIVASADRYISKGDPLPVYWTFSGNGIQTEWRIVSVPLYYKTKDTSVDALAVPEPVVADIGKYYEKSAGTYSKTSDTSIVSGKTYYIINKKYYTLANSVYTEVVSPSDSNVDDYYEFRDATVILEGKGSAGATQISAERLNELVIDDSLEFNVQASTGGNFVTSEPHTVTVIEQPTLSLDAPSSLTEQPYEFTAASDRLCDLIVIVTSQGVSGQYPQGILTQAAGDTIHSDVYTPVWENGSATVALPTGLNFLNKGKYTLSVVAVDRSTGLKSTEALSEFEVAWANEAVDIGAAVTLSVIDATDSDGDHRQAVQIDLTPPTGSAETDVYDIYRMDGDTVKLIGEGFPLTHTTADEYAPFGNADLKYRVALRTVDGDVSFTDIEYTAPCDSLRFDWDGGSIEFPYNLVISDKYQKDVKFRQHMDGSVEGYWNPNITRTASLSTDVIVLKQAREIELTRNLARYPGAVFVRTPNGNAYAADVQVSNMDSENKFITAIAIDATEVGMTQEFMLPLPEDEEEEE